MGQGHMILNLDRKECLHPHALGSGYKLLEIGNNVGPMLALAVLLAASNKGGARGGGDLRFDTRDPVARAIVGRWAGDRIAIVGDYADQGDLPPSPTDPTDTTRAPHMYHLASSQKGGWVDISYAVRSVLTTCGEWQESNPAFGPRGAVVYNEGIDQFSPAEDADGE